MLLSTAVHVFKLSADLGCKLRYWRYSLYPIVISLSSVHTLPIDVVSNRNYIKTSATFRSGSTCCVGLRGFSSGMEGADPCGTLHAMKRGMSSPGISTNTDDTCKSISTSNWRIGIMKNGRFWVASKHTKGKCHGFWSWFMPRNSVSEWLRIGTEKCN